METLKKIWNGFLDLFGLRRNSKYVSNYLNHANMRSGVYMAIVIVAIEIWMIIRQSLEKVKPMIETAIAKGQQYDFFKIFYGQTSNFWLFLFLGIVMALYCLYSTREKKSFKMMLAIAIVSALGLLLFAFIDYKTNVFSLLKKVAGIKSNVYGTFLLVFLVSVALFFIASAGVAFYGYKGGKSEWINSVLIISLFALICLAFGMMVSYSDYFGYAKDPVTGSTLTMVMYDEHGDPYTVKVLANKQVICFLMMTLYVGCLLIWKPYISIGILGIIFLGFHHVLVHLPGVNRMVQDGDAVNYLTFFISLAMVCVSIYNQRVAEGRKDEELELLATKDTLTDLYAFEYFITLSNKVIKDKDVDETQYMFLFFDITSFKIFNDQRGFDAGNKFLKDVGQILTTVFKDELISRQSDDHFVVFCHKDNIEEKIASIEKQVEVLDLDIRPGVKAGGYILKRKGEDPHRMVEKARYACAEIKHVGGSEYIEYDQKMHDSYHMIQ